jgi:hypothetical protein
VELHEMLGLAALVGALLALVLARWLRSWAGSRKAVRRARRSIAGESAAEDMLKAAGYEVVGRQATAQWYPLVDGEPHEAEVRADFLVENRRGELLVAEVKTGEAAPSLGNAATRRQLLEYLYAFEADGILLVCPERDAIHRVEFPER